MIVFGAMVDQATRTYLPISSCEWSIGDIVKKGKYDNIALLSFENRSIEAFDIRRCFNEVTHIFAFGHDVKGSVISVSLICFLGKGCESEEGGLNDISEITEAYEQSYRLYKNQKSVKIQIDKFSANGFLVGCTVGNVDPNSGVSVISLTFLPDQEV